MLNIDWLTGPAPPATRPSTLRSPSEAATSATVRPARRRSRAVPQVHRPIQVPCSENCIGRAHAGVCAEATRNYVRQTPLPGRLSDLRVACCLLHGVCGCAGDWGEWYAVLGTIGGKRCAGHPVDQAAPLVLIDCRRPGPVRVRDALDAVAAHPRRDDPDTSRTARLRQGGLGHADRAAHLPRGSAPLCVPCSLALGRRGADFGLT